MFSNRLAVAVLGVACITAAAAGGYFAAHQNAVPTPAAVQASDSTALAPVPDATAPRPVQETEALIGDTAKPTAAPPPPAPAAAPVPAPVSSRSARRAERVEAPPAPPSRHAAAPAPT